MKTIIDDLTAIAAAAFEKNEYDAALGTITLSDRPDLCQFQCNGALAGAKMYRTAPKIIAGKIAEELEKSPVFQSVTVVNPGFINLVVTDSFLIEKANAVMADPNLGIPQGDPGEKLILDYGGPNVAKPLHVGHLRAAVIGEALKRIARATGRTVYGDVHLGDWGLQMGLVIAAMEEQNPEWCCFQTDFDPAEDTVPAISAAELNDIYPAASKRSKEDEDFNRKAHEVTFELQNGNPGYRALWKAILAASIEDMKRIYDRLNVSFDFWYGESDAQVFIEELIQILEDKKLLYESQGALVVDVAEETDTYSIPPVIIQKSDKSFIYATTDLATILMREKSLAPQGLWYIVDKRQSVHFEQVFRCARKAGLVPATTELTHLPFGTMNGKDGKPYKTRDGGVMQLSDLYAQVGEAISEKLSKDAFSSAEELEKTVNILSTAVIKFGDLINHREKDYIFDIEKFTASEGKTGVYLLYTVTRMHSILRKAGMFEEQNRKPLTFLSSESERQLLLDILLSSVEFERAYADRAPNYLCEKAYAISSDFSKFYHENHILSEENPEKKENWLHLCLFTRRIMQTLLDVVGIDTVEFM